MLHLNEIVASAIRSDRPSDRAGGDPARAAVLTLSYDERRRSRLLATMDDGREVALMLPRGTILRHGDRLRGDGGLVVEVRAAAESLSIAATSDQHQLTRAAYHLGNRHVALEIGAGWVAYAHDHVLDDMVRGLGLDVSSRVAPFEPEAGAFQHDAGGGEHAHGGGGHSHGGGDNSHGGGRTHGDDHDHPAGT
jgi:urease accessory protein